MNSPKLIDRFYPSTDQQFYNRSDSLRNKIVPGPGPVPVVPDQRWVTSAGEQWVSTAGEYWTFNEIQWVSSFENYWVDTNSNLWIKGIE